MQYWNQAYNIKLVLHACIVVYTYQALFLIFGFQLNKHVTENRSLSIDLYSHKLLYMYALIFFNYCARSQGFIASSCIISSEAFKSFRRELKMAGELKR